MNRESAAHHFSSEYDDLNDTDSEPTSEEEEEENAVEKSEGEENDDQEYGKMSMEELLKLQEKIGTKSFKDKVLMAGGQRATSSKQHSMAGKVKPRQHKDCPTELPLMRKAAPLMKSVHPRQNTKKSLVRDPRFDDLSGSLNMDIWSKKYEFLKETRKNEREVLKKELKKEQDMEKKLKLKSVIQRMDNQEREQAKREKITELKRMERQQQKEMLRKGLKPKYMSTKERKMQLKTAHFNDLKKEDRIDKYLERKEKRLRAKEWRKKGHF
ncbi:hypothetical protein Pcinc_016245 [Petrolisthes cinctipes]|uniref:rRNA biogenesis protein RRP36 n=1 Tax=Petrolisthes cinctipes TaxID=88211 RepID=A0AAE1FU21_PETCI|nr:hypothetical protein Pcinc_016245 [Petrolisthes cinctipes]